MPAEGVTKALSFVCMAVLGRLVKSRFSKEQVAGVQKLILDVMLPCVIFKALCSIKVNPSLLLWPLLGALFVVAQLLSMSLCPLRGTPRRTALFQLATSAPGLSAMVFVKEFVGDAAAGKAALFDLPTKLYLILVLPRLLGVGRTSMADPLNAAIVGGLTAALTRTPFASFGFVSRAVDALAAAQTPVLFVLIGMKLTVTGATPAICLALLALRHAANYVFFSLAKLALSDLDDQLTLLLMCQAAVSVIGWSQMKRAIDAGVSGFDAAFAFDIVGFSMPTAMTLQTCACLMDHQRAISFAPYAAPVLLGLGTATLFALGSSLLPRGDHES